MTLTKTKTEIALDSQTLAILKIQAEKQGRKLKNYIEQVLKERAESFEISDEHKAILDDMLEKHNNGQLNYTSWEEFKEELKREEI